jgi:hypothetical protein
LLHQEKQPIREVQKRIKSDGIKEVIKLGQSIEKASRPKEITETALVPERIKFAEQSVTISPAVELEHEISKTNNVSTIQEITSNDSNDTDLQAALERLVALRRRWLDFRSSI